MLHLEGMPQLAKACSLSQTSLLQAVLLAQQCRHLVQSFAATAVHQHPAWLQVTRLKAEQRTVHPMAAAVSAKAGAATTDARSVVVHNVHFGATTEVVAAHFTQ